MASSVHLAAEDDAERTYIWGKSQRGLQAGARLVSATGKLQPGDPVVVEFVLKNTSDEKKTLVVQQYDNTYPVLGENNRIELNILGNSQRRWQHELESGEILKKRQYRVTFSTEGLPPGNYNATASSAFWLKIKPNRGTGVSHGRPIPFTIGDPESTELTSPELNEDPERRVFWGGPVAGLIVGARFPEGKSVWWNGDDLEAQMFLYNATGRVIEVEYEMPAVPTDWNLHLRSHGGQSVRLDSTWFSGARPRITRDVAIEPGQQLPITGIEAEVSVGGSDAAVRLIAGPRIQLRKERTEFDHGDPKRLIAGKGAYAFHAAITMRRKDIPDLAMVLSAGAIPFEANPDAE